VFGMATITLGIGPHSSSFFLMAALWNRAGHYIFVLFLLSSSLWPLCVIGQAIFVLWIFNGLPM